VCWPAGLANITCISHTEDTGWWLSGPCHIFQLLSWRQQTWFIGFIDLLYPVGLNSLFGRTLWLQFGSVFSPFRWISWSTPPSPHFEFLRAAKLGRGMAAVMCCQPSCHPPRFWSKRSPPAKLQGYQHDCWLLYSQQCHRLEHQPWFQLLFCCFFWCLHILISVKLFLILLLKISTELANKAEKQERNTEAFFFFLIKGRKRVIGEQCEFRRPSIQIINTSTSLYAKVHWWEIPIVDRCGGISRFFGKQASIDTSKNVYQRLSK